MAISTAVTFSPVSNIRNLEFSEIGSWESPSAIFLLSHLCKDRGEINCIDHFDLDTTAGHERYVRMNQNLTGKKFRILAQFSVPALMTLITEEMISNNPGLDLCR